MEDHKKKILIADDDPDILEALTLILEEEGYAVETTHDGLTLRSFEHGLPDLLLPDIWMSGWNGRDICQFLKSQEATQSLPILLFSANRETEQIAREAGADDFITKPFDLTDLLSTIKRSLWGKWSEAVTKCKVAVLEPQSPPVLYRVKPLTACFWTLFLVE